MVTGKGGMGTKIFGGVVLGLIVLTVLFSVLADMIPVAQSAGNAMNDTNVCEAVGCSFNATEAVQCRDATNNSVVCSEGSSSIPLSGLFTGTGVVFIIVMAFFLLLVVTALLTRKK